MVMAAVATPAVLRNSRRFWFMERHLWETRKEGGTAQIARPGRLAVMFVGWPYCGKWEGKRQLKMQKVDSTGGPGIRRVDLQLDDPILTSKARVEELQAPGNSENWITNRSCRKTNDSRPAPDM